MKIDKYKDAIVLENDNKKLNICVQVQGNLDFSMSLKSNNPNNKIANSFVIDDSNKAVYYAIAKLYESLLNEYNNNIAFYKERYSEYPIYNEKHEMFKFHSDNGNINEYNYEFIRLFRKNGIYYIFFNADSNSFKLSNIQSKYVDFVKYFNSFYNMLYTEYVKENGFAGKIYKYGD